MARADRVPFVPGQTLVTVRAMINGVRGTTLIADSGAQRMVISPRLALR